MRTILRLRRLLAVAFLFGISSSSWAYDIIKDGICYNYNIGGGSVTVTYNKNDIKYSGDITIPSSISIGSSGYEVTAIGKDAFKDCTDLTSISIPNSVTTICVFGVSFLTYFQ
jgi:hypothetical protein